MTDIGEPLENPDTVVFPVKDPVPRENPAPIPKEPKPLPVKREPKRIPA